MPELKEFIVKIEPQTKYVMALNQDDARSIVWNDIMDQGIVSNVYEKPKPIKREKTK